MWALLQTTELSNARHNTFLLLTKHDFGIYGFLRKSSDKLSKLKLNLVQNVEHIQAIIEVGVTHRLLNFEHSPYCFPGDDEE